MHIKFLIYNESNYNDVIRFAGIPLEHILGVYNDFSHELISRFEMYDQFPNYYKFIFYYFNSTLDLSKLTREILKKINSDKFTYLMLWNTHEPYLNISEIDKQVQKYNINHNKVIVVSSDSNIKIKYHHFFADSWWEAYYRYHINTHQASFIHPTNYNLNFTKKALCLNRNIRPHRIWNYFLLKETELLDQSCVSYHLPYINEDQKKYQETIRYSYNDILSQVENEIPKKYIIQFQKQKDFLKKPNYLDNLDYVYNLQNSIIPYYQKTAFSIVSETVIDKTFISEKTFKPIAHCHPFISIASNENAEYLKNNGYELYTNLFHIDNITNIDDAYEMYKQLQTMDISILRKKIKKIKKQCTRNWFNFFNRTISLKKFIRNIIVEISKT